MSNKKHTNTPTAFFIVVAVLLCGFAAISFISKIIQFVIQFLL